MQVEEIEEIVLTPVVWFGNELKFYYGDIYTQGTAQPDSEDNYTERCA